MRRQRRCVKGRRGKQTQCSLRADQQARQLQQTIPTPKHTGVQRLIEWEGTPVFGATPAAADAPPPVGPQGVPQPVA